MGVQHVRAAGGPADGRRSCGQDRPHVQDIPQGHQVHVQKVR